MKWNPRLQNTLYWTFKRVSSEWHQGRSVTQRQINIHSYASHKKSKYVKSKLDMLHATSQRKHLYRCSLTKAFKRMSFHLKTGFDGSIQANVFPSHKKEKKKKKVVSVGTQEKIYNEL